MASIPQGDYVEIQYGDRPVDPLASAIRVMERRLDQHIGQGGSQHAAATEEMAGFMSAVDKQKMEGIQAGATRNSPDEFLLNRGNHTGLQAIETVEGLRQQLDDALAGGSNFRGLFPSLAALQQDIPVAAPGNYADVDEGQDINAVRYIWDESDQAWVSGGEGEPLTAPQVKALYESNPNTNPLTDMRLEMIQQSFEAYSSSPLTVNGVAELRQTQGRFPGDKALLSSYIEGDGKGSRILTWVPEDSSDDGGMFFSAPGGSWHSSLDAMGRVSSEFYGMPLADGEDCYASFEAMYQYCLANKVDMWVGPGPSGKGRYNFGSNSCPISGPRVAGQPMLSIGFTMYSCPQVTLETISNGGADVLNLCSLSDFRLIGYPKINGTILSSDGAGSNGVSLVFGARDLLIEVSPENMPRVWLENGGTDGGHASTIQYGPGVTSPYENVTLNVLAEGCVSGFNIDFSPTDTVQRPQSGIKVNLIGKNCYRGVTIGGLPPTSSVVDPATPQPVVMVDVEAYLMNCQQPYLNLRSWGVRSRIDVLNTLEAADLRYHPYDQLVEVARILSVYGADIDIRGRVLSVDSKYRIGGLNMAGNAYAAISNSDVSLSVSSASGTRLTVDDPSGAGQAIRNSVIKLWDVGANKSALDGRAVGSTIYLEGSLLTPTLFPGDETVQAPGGQVSRVIYKAPITGVRSVNLPASANSGDEIDVIRQSSATGGTLAFSPFGNISPGQRARAIFDGSSWISVPIS